jgi:starvation-inducible outer membrane lipoprotein
MKSKLTRVLLAAVVLTSTFALSACKQQPDNAPPPAPTSQAPTLG